MSLRRLMMAQSAGAVSYFSEVAADSPTLWFRHAEASGTTMVAQVGSNGTYSASIELAQAAIYTGGPTCMWARSNRHGGYSAGVPALNSLTVECLIQFVSLGGFRGLVCNDDGSARRWQMRMNGSSFEFVKIAGGVSTISVAGGLSTGVTYHMAVTVSAAGVVKLYRNGTLLTTSSALGAADYGSGGQIQIGFMSGGGGASADAYISESAVYATELSGARILAHSAAAGL